MRGYKHTKPPMAEAFLVLLHKPEDKNWNLQMKDCNRTTESETY